MIENTDDILSVRTYDWIVVQGDTITAMAASVAGGQMLPLQPNPAPTYGQITCASFGSLPNKVDNDCWAPEIASVAVQTVSRSPFQRATVACACASVGATSTDAAIQT